MHYQVLDAHTGWHSCWQMGHHHRYVVVHAVEARDSYTAGNRASCYTSASACTGASRGIGQAIAEQMADEKANLILLAQREGALNEVLSS